MSTQWTNNGAVVAVSRWAGEARGKVVEVESGVNWEEVGTVTDEGGNEVSREEVEEGATVVSWNRWRANRRANDWKAVSRRWAESGEETVAHKCAAEAQRWAEEARQSV